LADAPAAITTAATDSNATIAANQTRRIPYPLVAPAMAIPGGDELPT
jgi:hypothetical protein